VLVIGCFIARLVAKVVDKPTAAPTVGEATTTTFTDTSGGWTSTTG
jgi:hypothetical protein